MAVAAHHDHRYAVGLGFLEQQGADVLATRQHFADIDLAAVTGDQSGDILADLAAGRRVDHGNGDLIGGTEEIHGIAYGTG